MNNSNDVLMTLKLHPLYKYFGFSGGILVLSILVFQSFSMTQEDVYPMIAMFVLCILLFGLLILGAIVYKVTAEREGIEQITFLGKRKFIVWDDIDSISFSLISLELKIKSKDEVIKVHQHMVGFNALMLHLETTTNISRKEMGLV